MINISQNFKNAMTAPVKILRGEIREISETENPETAPQIFTSGDNLVSFSVNASGYYFGAATRSLEFCAIGTNFDAIDKTFAVKIGAQIDSENEIFEDLDLGKFVVYEQTSDLEKEITTFRAYDLMGIFAKKLYSENILTFPCTVANLAQQIAASENILLDENFANLPNANYEIAQDLYEKIANTTFRDIIAEIAGATASLAKISPENNSLIFQPLQKMTTEILTYDNLRSVKFGAKYGAVNSVVLARTPAEDNIVLTDEVDISANGLTEVKLANNEILDDDRENLIQPIFDAAKGFYFTPATAETEGHGWHEIGDRIRVENLENSWEIIVTNSKITLDGGIKETLQSVAPTETQTNYARAGGIIKTIYNTEIKVDKQNQEISSVVEKMETIDDEIANNFTKISQNLENITQTVQYSGGANLVKNSVGYAIIDGKITGWEYAAEYKNGEITAVSAPLPNISQNMHDMFAAAQKDFDTDISSDIVNAVNASYTPEITVKIGEEKILDRVVSGINDMSFLRNQSVINI